MLINGLNKFVKQSGMTEVDKLTRSASGVAKSESLSQERKYRATKSQRKSRARGKKG